MSGPLDGLRVVEISDTIAGAQAGQFLADLGAEVVAVEPPGGGVLRRAAAYPFLARGKKSVVLDLHEPADADVARGLASEADIVITTVRPTTLERFGLDHPVLSALNPRLVYGSITGWGRTGPLRDAKGYEGMVMAKLGILTNAFGKASVRPGPTFATVPYASYSATQALLQGIFAALYERETSGLGQLVETSLAKSLSGQDPWNQANTLIAQRFPDAFLVKPPVSDDGVPNYNFTYLLLVAMTKDGHWLQFSQTQPHLFRAFIRSCGLEWMYEDPRWKTLPNFEPVRDRMEFWNILLTEVRKRTLAEWEAVFDEDPNVSAETFRRGSEVLHHPQMRFGGHTVTIEDPERGAVLQPAALVRLSGTPAVLDRGAPRVDEHGAELRARAVAAQREHVVADANLDGGLPLAGVTILELGTFYAAPFGATVLTDLGARVIKIEPPAGDPIRFLQPFPEAGALKVLQGKESVALDLGAPEAKEILEKIAATADLVLCSFRAGAAERLGVGAQDLLARHPNLFYLNAPGYGVDGPYGHRPAFAPTMSAGSGMTMRNAGSLVPEDDTDDLAVLRARSIQLNASGTGSAAQPDGVAALTVATALTLGAYFRKRGVAGQHALTTMLNSCTHALCEAAIEYADKPQPPTADADGFGFGPLYRLYEASEGWVFLAAPTKRDWANLIAQPAFAALAEDPRFVDADARAAHASELADALAAVFTTQKAAEWERDLLAADIGCVEADKRRPEQNYLGEFGQEHDYLVTVDSPILEEYPRVGPLVGFSRSETVATVGCTLGQHTESVLREYGYDDEAIADMAARGVIVTG
ncbi:CaiB/BaiF CoA-transferase family protein [Amycolatopsis sp. GM8]|uniref:CaiB/BaiF CoA transferase family protein n=1 Tax=Amycolatopsis sp. GM8 TaxID=2896530 RepID=UPI001F3BE452|nr:CoA transferase [Amycolatopsis sp. GM8]